MIQKVAAFVEQHHMVEEGSHVLAGVSGGADSVCLLLVLLGIRDAYRLRLTVVHVEHGIRGADSLQDAAFVEALCREHGVPCVVHHRDAVAFSREQGMSLEEGARALRYRCFAEEREKCGADRIAVAHNQNDCGETLLFQLSRGSGLRGMRGIVPVRGAVIRPLLCVSRREIEGFLKERGQGFCTDATNFETAYSRNKIRHQVLPVLEEINGEAVAHLYRSARCAAEAVELVERLAKEARARCVKDRVLSELLLKEPPLVQKTLVLELLGEWGGNRRDLAEVHVLDVLDLFQKQVGRRKSLPYGLVAIRVYGGVEISGKSEPGRAANSGNPEIGRAAGSGKPEIGGAASSEKQEPASGSIFGELEPGKTVELPRYGWQVSARLWEKTEDFREIPKKTYTKWFDYDKIKNTLLLRTGCRSDFFTVNAQGGHQSLKKYLVNEKVDARKRDDIPVLAEGTHIVWAIGYRISEAYKVTEDTKVILEVQVNGGSIYE